MGVFMGFGRESHHPGIRPGILGSWDTTSCVFSSIGNPFPVEPSLIVCMDTKRLTDRKIEKLFSFFDFLQLPFLPLSRARATHSFEFGNILSGRGNDTSRSFSHSIYRWNFVSQWRAANFWNKKSIFSFLSFLFILSCFSFCDRIVPLKD